MNFVVAIATQVFFLGGILGSPVNELTSVDIDASINHPSKDLWLITYYDPECTYSKALMPVIDDIGNLFGNHMALGKVDCRKEAELCSEIKVYPSLKWYRDGEFHDYEGAKDRDGILSFAVHMTSQPVKSLVSHEDIFHGEGLAHDVAFVMSRSFSSTCRNFFESVARKFQYQALFIELEMNEVNKAWIGEVTKQKSNDILIRKERYLASDNVIVFGGDCSMEALTRFVQEHSRGVVPELTPKNVNSLGGPHKYLALGVVDPAREESKAFLSELRAWVSAIAPSSSIKNHYSFAWANALEWSTVLAKYNVKFGGEPEFVVIDIQNELYWNVEKEGTISESMETMETFLRKIMSKEVVPKLVSTEEDDESEDFIPGMWKNQAKFFEDHPRIGLFMIFMWFFDVIFFVSMTLPPENKFARFMEKNVGSRMDRILGIDTMSEKEKED